MIVRGLRSLPGGGQGTRAIYKAFWQCTKGIYRQNSILPSSDMDRMRASASTRTPMTLSDNSIDLEALEQARNLKENLSGRSAAPGKE